MTPTHQSDSTVQQGAERAIIAALATDLAVTFVAGGDLHLGGGARIRPDAISEDGAVVVEAFARQGRLKGGQVKKIAQDVLKLALLRREPDYANARTIIAFASDEALSSISGWLRRAAEVFDVELVVVDIANELRAEILKSQAMQNMVNVPLSSVADDLTVED